MNEYNDDYRVYNEDYSEPADYNVSIKSMKNIFIPLIFFAGLTLFFVIGLVIGINSTLEKKQFENAPEVVAVVSNIESYRNSNGDISYRTWITYEIDGQSYTENLRYYSSSMRVGVAVTIKYLADDPTSFYYEGSNGTMMIIAYIFSVPFFICLIIIIRFGCINYSLIKLKRTGNRRRVVVVGYYENMTISINRRFPFCLVCLDNLTQKHYVTSKYFIDPFDKYPLQTKLSLYLDKENDQIFYIDCNKKQKDY